MICDVKTSAKAWNDGIDAFENAMNLNGDPRKSLTYALSQIKKNNPDLNFSEDSFVEPVVEAYKKAGIIPQNFKYGKEKLTKIEKALENFKTLSDPEKKELAADLAKQ